jgi:sulfur carrier protein
MTLTVNGEAVEMTGPCTVRHFLALRGLEQAPCAVEVNRRLVPRARQEEHVLREGDVVEVVTLVGGG